jgi:MSHA biogenesis protein MshJ
MSLNTIVDQFNARAMRERILITVTAIALLLAVWDSLLMAPLRNTTHDLRAELGSYGTGTVVLETDGADPHQAAIRRANELQLQVQTLDAQIAGTASRFVPAQRMIGVLQGVLDRQGSIRLVSIQNLPARPLTPIADASTPPTPPYIHSIEIVIEGRYAEIQEYMQQLESLPWKFQWTVLELTAKDYPVNRVRLQLSTLSMDATWLGVQLQ